jgi:hypothetical protein
MTRRLLFIAVLFTAAIVTPRGAITASGAKGLVVHEWGTFTSIAGEDGRPVQWLPHAGSTDLPCFVGRIHPFLKAQLHGAVRMETPVIYFYAPHEMTVDVDVQFRQGVITEWFPRATTGAGSGNDISAAFKGAVAWKNVKVMPGAAVKFPLEGEPNHYYVARQTDAAPLQSASESEKFLFYRGVGRLAPPLAGVFAGDGRVVVRNTRGDDLGDIMLFQNRRGRIAYESRNAAVGEVTFAPLTPADEAGSPQADLQKMLVAHGLYPKEAKAMVESWRDSWFEEGTRLFYIVPTQAVDAMLPLKVEPRPAQIARVFVGRLEIASPDTLRQVSDALARNDQAALERHGRFLQAIARRLLPAFPANQRTVMERRLQSAYSSVTPAHTCR